MTYYMSDSNQRLGKAMSQEQLTQIIEAILAGKYSWACVLLLRFAGYNPLHYIPYRTYNRLVKENCQLGSSSIQKDASINTENQGVVSLRDRQAAKAGSKITDLSFSETINEPHSQVRGGLFHWF